MLYSCILNYPKKFKTPKDLQIGDEAYYYNGTYVGCPIVCGVVSKIQEKSFTLKQYGVLREEEDPNLFIEQQIGNRYIYWDKTKFVKSVIIKSDKCTFNRDELNRKPLLIFEKDTFIRDTKQVDYGR